MRYVLIPVTGTTLVGELARSLEAGGLSDGEWGRARSGLRAHDPDVRAARDLRGGSRREAVEPVSAVELRPSVVNDPDTGQCRTLSAYPTLRLQAAIRSWRYPVAKLSASA